MTDRITRNKGLLGSIPSAPDVKSSTEDSAYLLQPLTAALLECVTPTDVVAAVLERGAAVLGAEAGLVVMVSEADTTGGDAYLDIVGAQGYADDLLGAWKRFPLSASLPLSDAVRTQTPLFFTRRGDMEARYPAMFRQGPLHTVKASVSLPLVARGQAFGGLHFSFPQEREAFEESDRAFLLELERQCALALDRALLLGRLEAARVSADGARARQELLSDASALLGESLDYQSRLESLARLCVPKIADWAGVDVLDDAGQLVRLAVAHRLPEREAVMREIQRRYPPSSEQGATSLTVIQTGERILYPDISEAAIDSGALDSEHARLLKTVGISAALSVPIVARGRTFGSLTLGMGPAPDGSGRSFREEDILLAEELARRAGVAVENARLYAKAQGENAERIRAEKDLTASESRFRALADNIAQLAWMADGTGWIFWYNRRWFEYTGTTLETMQGWGWSKVHHPDYVEAVTEKFLVHLATGEPWEDTFPLQGKDGQFRWFLSRAFPSTDIDGKIVLWCGTNTDITDEIEAGIRQRRFLKEMLAGFTEGRLRLCFSENELPAPLPPQSETLVLTESSLRLLRKRVEAVAEGLMISRERLQEFMTAVHEAAMNAVRHGGGGTARIHGDAATGVLQVWISDSGPGIAEELIHRAIERGFTTNGFGHGMFFMQSCTDRLYLYSETGKGTTVILEEERTPPEPSWLQSAG